MTAHIIHDTKRRDRLETLQREISEQGIEVQFFPAIVHHVPCTGIVRAHKNVIQWAKNHDLPMIAIVEDDVKFTAPGAWDYFCKTIPKEFDIYAAGIAVGKPDKKNVVKKFAGAFCYIIHSRFYNTFLNFNESINIATNVSHTDGLYIVSSPMVAKTYDGFSDHRGKYVDHSRYFKNYKYMV